MRFISAGTLEDADIVTESWLDKACENCTRRGRLANWITRSVAAQSRGNSYNVTATPTVHTASQEQHKFPSEIPTTLHHTGPHHSIHFGDTPQIASGHPIPSTNGNESGKISIGERIYITANPKSNRLVPSFCFRYSVNKKWLHTYTRVLHQSLLSYIYVKFTQCVH